MTLDEVFFINDSHVNRFRQFLAALRYKDNLLWDVTEIKD